MRRHVLGPLVLALVLAGGLAADTIVLKSGRRIEAWAVEQRGDRVYWETEAGRLSLPRRLVERIERSPEVSGPPRSAGLAGKVAGASLATLDAAGVGEVVVNGQVNRELVAQLENQADRGDATARVRAAAAHAAVAEHFYAAGDVAAAIGSLERALVYAPNHPVLLLNLASLYYTQRDFPRALEALERAGRERALAFEVLRLRGMIQYEMEKLDAAIASWKQALALRADAEVQQWVARAEREAGASAGYRETGSGRFTLRYSGEAAASPRLVREVMETLERDFSDLSSRLDYLPREPLVVVLYTNEAFTSVTGVPAWVDAVHDGKIRVLVQGLTSLTGGRLREVLRHELSHAFIQEKSRGRAPLWLHEGLGQWFEGVRSSGKAHVLRQAAEGGPVSVAGIEALLHAGSFEEVSAGYLLALAVVETMMDIYGINGINRLLEELGRGASLEAALRAGYRMDVAELEDTVRERLRRR